ncbi:peptide chain release factor N(5)-glutamine methyltransferase [Synechococcus sp. L2F]|uniref:peptide chain release factor N(5)-glutamine methyltransferase n=1 Tax=Synechococcus sp. L2F TaxID=2823739 RepID=UPI0020CEA019|nr:peptide chain release factor N(5)-glutamine methyltransferase [Synechococcus sp. L2F]
METPSTGSPGPIRLSGKELWPWRREQLRLGGVAADFDWLLDLAGGVDGRCRHRLRLEPELSVDLRCSLGEIERLWRRHLSEHIPLQYLVGLCPWRDLELVVGPGALIPRQETEWLVELALELAGALAPGWPRRWADLGCGSGCLAVALALAFPEAQGWAVDCSPEALHHTHNNLQRARVQGRVAQLEGSWWDPLQAVWGQLDLVVSNPPYIPSAEVSQLDPVVRWHEPHLALDGGADGLDAVRLIAAGALQALAPGGWLLLEHHHDQSSAVCALLSAAGLEAVVAHKDLEGHFRFAQGRRPPIPH